MTRGFDSAAPPAATDNAVAAAITTLIGSDAESDQQAPGSWLVNGVRATLSGVRGMLPPEAQVAITLGLLGLLSSEQALRVTGSPRAVQAGRVVDLTILPMLVLFALVAAQRFGAMIAA